MKVSRPRGQVVVIVIEFLSSLAVFAINLVALLTHTLARHDSVAIAGLIVWAYIFTLTTLRLALSRARLALLSNLWHHTAFLYMVQWIFIVLLFRSEIIHPHSHGAQEITIVKFALSTLLAVIAITSRKGNKTIVLEYRDGLEPSHEPLASLFSIATFGWVDAIVWRGYRKTSELPDVWNLDARDKSAALLADFRQFRKTSKLAWHLVKYFKRDLVIQAAWAMISGALTFVPTLFLKAFLEYVEDPEETPVNAAWFYMILLAFTSCIKAITEGQALWIGRRICINLRAVIVGEIYAKVLRRKAAAETDTVLGNKQTKAEKNADKEADFEANANSNAFTYIRCSKKSKAKKIDAESTSPDDAADSQVNVGTIINLMAVDSFKVSEVSAYLHFLWGSIPVQLVLCIVLLYRTLGWSAVASVVLIFLIMPLNLFIAKQFTKVQKQVMVATDLRIHTTNEIMSNVRIIKYFAWEQRFGQNVDEKRAAELKALLNKYILWTFATGVWLGVPVIIPFFSFLFYTVVEKKPLIPSVAFTALSLFGIFRYPLTRLADIIARVQESKVSIDRVEEFLNEDETEKYDQLLKGKTDESGGLVIGFDMATLIWEGKDANSSDGQTAFRMIDLDIHFVVGGLNIVTGPTGSGKTSLLMALLGEMTLLKGSVFMPGCQSREILRANPETGLTEGVAYCAQQAWLVNDTIKQNILFASLFDESRYRNVIAVCALERDLQILDKGDSTLVGEKGVTLSGGQKQRISLARALYCNSRHVLLDDCLSAVDSHTAKYIFEMCVMGPLMFGRTCIFVTHNLALCVPRAHFVVALMNGKVAAQGSPDEMMSSGALGDEVLNFRAGSESGSQIHSRVLSATNLKSEAEKGKNDHSPKANSHVNGSAKGPDLESKHQDEVENANLRTERKATGSINIKTIHMYLRFMGPWQYWLLAFVAFTLQQAGSVAANVWIRVFVNAGARSAQKVDTIRDRAHISGSSYFRDGVYSSGCHSTATCFLDLPMSTSSSYATEFIVPVTDEKVNAWYYLTIYALIGFVFILISLFQQGHIFWGSLRASKMIHRKLFESITRAKLQFFDTTPLGQLMNRFSKDIESVDQDIAPIAFGLLGYSASLISIIVVISVITPRFLIAGFFISCIYITIGQFYLRSSRDLKRLESVQRSPLYQHFGETLSGIVTIRAYGDERRFIRANQSRVDTHNRPFIYFWAANIWLQLRIDFAGALVSFFAGVFAILGAVDAGSAGLSLTYAFMFAENVLWLVRLYSINEQNMNSVERIKEYIEVEQEAQAIIEDARPAGNWPSHGAIQFTNFTTKYRADLQPVLQDLTFNIQPGERVGIVGRTGAGKSSLALALLRGLEAEKGKIVIDNLDISLIGLQSLREAITIVPQDPTLFTGTVRSNLDPFSLFTDEEIFATLRRVQLISAPPLYSGSSAAIPVPAFNATTPPDFPQSLEDNQEERLDLAKVMTITRENANIFTTLSSPVAESGSNLSQGQRQLLCLARAILRAPRVLLMDEATASIDYATDSSVQDTLREVKECTIITIAHRLQTIIDYDKVLVLDKGKVVEYDAPWKLIAKGGVFRSLCEMSGDLETLEEGAQKAAQKKKLIDV